MVMTVVYARSLAPVMRSHTSRAVAGEELHTRSITGCSRLPRGRCTRFETKGVQVDHVGTTVNSRCRGGSRRRRQNHLPAGVPPRSRLGREVPAASVRPSSRRGRSLCHPGEARGLAGAVRLELTVDLGHWFHHSCGYQSHTSFPSRPDSTHLVVARSARLLRRNPPGRPGPVFRWQRPLRRCGSSRRECLPRGNPRGVARRGFPRLP